MSIASAAHSPASTRPGRVATQRVVVHGVVAGAIALTVIEAYAALAKTAGVPLRAGLPDTHTASLITAGSFATGILVAAFWGTVVALVLARNAVRPVRTFTRVAVTATALSLITPLAAFGASLSTKLTLVAAHLIAATIMTTVLRRGIS
ncbi:MAG: hypothetical protein JO130_16350 [Solirubrobacterales bacterium]|nr:hypothetical protein [Solirubrobacterales bacterium]